MEGDESNSKDADSFMGPLVRLARTAGCAIVISHHLGKGYEGLSRTGCQPSKDWLRGSSAIAAACRSIWIVDAPNAEQPTVRRITLVKTASGPKDQVMGFSMGNPADGLNFNTQLPTAIPRFQKDKLESWLLGVLKQSGDEGLTKHRLHDLAKKEGSSTTSLDKLMSKLQGQKIDKVICGKQRYWKCISGKQLMEK